jgi:YD repeat-containing protein
VLQSIIGQVRMPARACITITTAPETGVVTLSMENTSFAGKTTTYTQTYDSKGYLSAQTVMDLLSWLRHTATVFFKA